MTNKRLILSVCCTISLCCLATSSCSFSQQRPSSLNIDNPVQDELPLANETSWIYSDAEYQPEPSDPTNIITARYQITDTVIDVDHANGLFVAHLKQDTRLIQAPSNWTSSPSSQADEFWYVVRGSQVFKSEVPFDLQTVDLGTLQLIYDFPLLVGKSWCPFSVDLKDPRHPPLTSCENGGKQAVIQQSADQTPAGSFKNCYLIEQFYNDGGITQLFCKSVGVVEVKFDHNGTRFGFEQKLTGYVAGKLK